MYFFKIGVAIMIETCYNIQDTKRYKMEWEK